MTMTSASQVNPAERILMGPGPSSVPHRILRALSAPTLGHLDPQYLAIMDEVAERRRTQRAEDAVRHAARAGAHEDAFGGVDLAGGGHGHLERRER